MEPHPIRMVVDDDLHRSRLTVFFRLLLAIPHFVWLALWSLGVLVVAPLTWIATLISARPPGPFWSFLSAYVRYATHVYAFLLLAANPFPGFLGKPGTYPVDLEIDESGRQNRWKTAFRIVLAIPAFMVASALLGGLSGGGGGGGRQAQDGGDQTGFFFGPAGVAFTIAFLAWFACLVRARMPGGFRDAVAYALRYGAQTWGYFLFLTDRYPDSSPSAPAPARPPHRPVAVTLTDDDLRRSRLTVFFRLLLFLPHLVWLILWGIAVVFVLILGWFAALVLGRLPSALHRFLAAYARYQTHAFAFLTLVANPFPGFLGAAGSYPVDVRIDPPERQNRWKTGFRVLLAIPAFLVDSALGGALWLVAFLSWFVGLFLGRIPAGLRGLGAYALGYSAQTNGYVYLLTDVYPYSGPPGVDVEPEPEPEPEEAPGWPAASPSPSF